MIRIKLKGIYISMACILLGNLIFPINLQGQSQKADPFLIRYNQVGKLTLGGYLKELFWNYSPNRIGKVFVHMGDQIFSQYEIVSPNKKEIFFSVEPDCREGDSLCIIKRIEIYNPEFHTKENIKVGMLFQDLTNSGLKIGFLGMYRGNLIARTTENPINYILSTSGIPKKWFSTMDPKYLPFSTRIIGIVLTGSQIEGYTFRQFDSLKFGRKFLDNNLVIAKTLESHTKVSSIGKIQTESKTGISSSSGDKKIQPNPLSGQSNVPTTILASKLSQNDHPAVSISDKAGSLQTKSNPDLKNSLVAKAEPVQNQKLSLLNPPVTKPKTSAENINPMVTKTSEKIIPESKGIMKETFTQSTNSTLNSVSIKPLAKNVESIKPGISAKSEVRMPPSTPIPVTYSNSPQKMRDVPEKPIPNDTSNRTENEKLAYNPNPSRVNFIIASQNETIFMVSQRFNISISEIFDYNPFLVMRSMKPGDKIYLVNKDSISSLESMGVDPYHTQGPVSKVYLKSKDYTFGDSPGSVNTSDSLNTKIRNNSLGVKNK